MKNIFLAVCAVALIALSGQASAGLTQSNLVRSSAGNQNRINVDLAFDSSYPTGGESITAASLGLAYMQSCEIKGMDSGYGFDCVLASDGTTASIKAYQASAQVSETVTVTDDNTAATNGVAVYVHTDNGVGAHLEFVSPTSADGTGTLATSGNAYFISHDATNAALGKALYFDEDATNEDSRFLVVSPSGQDLHFSVGGGKTIKFKHDASAASNGVQVYFDEDATPVTARLRFVSPTNVNGSGATDTAWTGTSGVPTEVADTTNLSALTGVQLEALGK